MEGIGALRIVQYLQIHSFVRRHKRRERRGAVEVDRAFSKIRKVFRFRGITGGSYQERGESRGTWKSIKSA